MKRQFNISFIKEHLQHGEIKKLAKDYGISESTAYKNLSTKCREFNLGFMTSCQKLVTERELARLAQEEKEKLIYERRAALTNSLVYGNHQ